MPLFRASHDATLLRFREAVSVKARIDEVGLPGRMPATWPVVRGVDRVPKNLLESDLCGGNSGRLLPGQVPVGSNPVLMRGFFRYPPTIGPVVVVLTLALLLMFVVAAWLTLAACGAVVPTRPWLFTSCPASAADQNQALERAVGRNAVLVAKVASLEVRLARLQCPVPAPEITGFEPRRWAARDLGMLDGCWILEPTRNVRNIEGHAIDFNDWTMCFGESGHGDLRFLRDREQCTSGAIAMFDSDGRLVIDTSGNILCDGEFAYFRRVMTCIEDGNGSADCDIVAPDYPERSRGSFKMSRR